MNKILSTLLCFALVCHFSPAHANDGDLNQYKEDTDALYRTGSGAEEGAYSAISTSMLGWGVGLAVGIAILAGVLHQSTANTAHTTTSQCH
jgi:hypothetical protein